MKPPSLPSIGARTSYWMGLCAFNNSSACSKGPWLVRALHGACVDQGVAEAALKDQHGMDVEVEEQSGGWRLCAWIFTTSQGVGKLK
jgi:hypothetical protein